MRQSRVPLVVCLWAALFLVVQSHGRGPLKQLGVGFRNRNICAFKALQYILYVVR